MSTSTTLPSPAAEPNQDILTIVPGVLTVGTEALVPPWYVGSTPASVTAGFEYDLAKAIAARLGVPSVRVVVTPLVTLLSGQDCKCDLMLSEVLVTDNRARTARLHRAVPDRRPGRSGALRSVDGEHRGGTLVPVGCGVEEQCGTRRARRSAIKPTIAPQTFVDETDGIQRVADGRLDAMITQTPTAVAAAAEQPGARRRGPDADRTSCTPARWRSGRRTPRR